MSGRASQPARTPRTGPTSRIPSGSSAVRPQRPERSEHERREAFRSYDPPDDVPGDEELRARVSAEAAS